MKVFLSFPSFPFLRINQGQDFLEFIHAGIQLGDGVSRQRLRFR